MGKKRKRGMNGPLVLVIVLAMILAGLIIVYINISGVKPVLQFAGQYITTKDGADAIRARRTRSDKPYELTDGQKYYKELVNKNNINVLIIGPDETSGNYDTMMIVSVDDENNVVKMINIPRDLYIKYSDEFKQDLKKAWSKYASSKGIFKINASHTLGKRVNYKNSEGRFKNPEYDFTADLIEEVFGVYIDDVIFIKPASVRKVVDYFGGVEIDVPYRMKYSDPTQNLEIDIEKGLQKLNGKDAEGFLRFRQGYDEKGKFKNYGDIERKKNQVAFVKAFINQHLNLNNLGKIINIFNDLSSYIDTSVSDTKEAAEYGKLAEELYRNKFTQESEEIECKDEFIDGIYYLILREK
ncbi:MAG TPA: LCP family protein [Clostridiaceae bacterium]|nr:LCP family protein [Clostridiaceae bacterium]